MSSRDEWIKINLSPSDVDTAKVIADGSFGSDSLKYKHGFASPETYRIGALGEVAFCRYLGRPHPHPLGNHRGSDAYGWEIRTRSSERYDLNLHKGDEGKKFALLLGHDAPVMYLVGWIKADDGLKVATYRNDGTGDTRWCYVLKSRLTPFPETALHRRASTAGPHCAAVLESNENWWCENCNGTHPIKDMKDCRSGLLLERSRRVRGLLYPPN